ncbi:hypothetical protein T265_11536 [Opisthorchis viverrini]|uniref:G-protein coupled receptors family 1 profile domain-containing protein n=1 Tax=Opisthorchis viverrini TaxID=6198 RepID=A0A074YYA3_OPIVI|nr:hypothetical protein T265_11536 [Opisthorchis viverrini]KER19771.1 hypothetical protein T265_11536 [Opisthorchis viverrini]
MDINTIGFHSAEPNLRFVADAWLMDVCGAYPQPSSYHNDWFKKLVIHYLLPVITILVLVTNIIVCFVFARQRVQSPVYAILLAIGCTELLNSLLPLPMYVAESLTGRNVWWEDLPSRAEQVRTQSDNLTHWWHLPSQSMYRTSSNLMASQISSWTTVTLPTITYTISVFLTVLLALQRLVYVSWPLKAMNMCSLKFSRIAIIAVVLLGILLHVVIIHSKFITVHPVVVHVPQPTIFELPETFVLELDCLVRTYSQLPRIVLKCNTCGLTCMIVYIWARTFVIHIIPCCSLCVITARLVVAMREAAKRRARLQICAGTTYGRPEDVSRIHSEQMSRVLEQCRESEEPDRHCTASKMLCVNRKPVNYRSRAAGSPTNVAKMLVAILIKFLLAHIPEAVVIMSYSLWRIYNTHLVESAKSPDETQFEAALLVHNQSIDSHPTDQPLSTDQQWYRLITICNLIVLISNQLNFLIYWQTSTDFRNSFKQLCSWQLNCFQKFGQNGIRDPCFKKTRVPKPIRTPIKRRQQVVNSDKCAVGSSNLNVIIFPPSESELCGIFPPSESEMCGDDGQFATFIAIRNRSVPFHEQPVNKVNLPSFSDVDSQNVSPPNEKRDVNDPEEIDVTPRYSLLDGDDSDSINVQISSV